MKRSELRKIIREEIEDSLEWWKDGENESKFQIIKSKTEKALKNKEDEFEAIDGGGFRVTRRDVMMDIIGAYEFEEISDDEVAAKVLDSDMKIKQQATIPFKKMEGILERNFYI
jgi:hypothetical protein